MKEVMVLVVMVMVVVAVVLVVGLVCMVVVAVRVAENIFWMQSKISKVKLDEGARISKF